MIRESLLCVLPVMVLPSAMRWLPFGDALRLVLLFFGAFLALSNILVSGLTLDFSRIAIIAKTCSSSI